MFHQTESERPLPGGGGWAVEQAGAWAAASRGAPVPVRRRANGAARGGGVPAHAPVAGHLPVSIVGRTYGERHALYY